MKALKSILFRLYVAWFRNLTRLKGVELPDSAIVNKMPRIRMVKGSRIILGEAVTLTSNPRHNPLLEHPVALRTLTPSAVIEMKDGSGMSGSRIVCCNRVTIGEDTIIGPNTLIYDSEGHNYSPSTGWKESGARTGRPITIGRKCFIGANCLIMSGVTIGDNCVISAGSVVTENVPTGYKAAGNPAICSPLPKLLGGPGRKKHAADVLS